jgi:hypothetical protein
MLAAGSHIPSPRACVCVCIGSIEQASRDWHMVEEEKRLLEKVRGMYGSTGRSPRGLSHSLSAPPPMTHLVA